MRRKKKLKLKKSFKVIIFLIVVLVIGLFVGKVVYEEYVYKNSYEYKLEIHGYTPEEVSLLLDNLTNEELDDLLVSEVNDTLINIIEEKYYLKKNLQRYLDYYDNHKSTELTDIIAIVNVNADYETYEHDIDADISKDDLILCNKYYKLSSTYEPDDIVQMDSKYFYGDSQSIREEVYDAFIQMWNAANDEGIYLIVNSSYRTYDDQEEVYNYYKETYSQQEADEVAARAGYSEHQTGLAIDIFSKDSTLRSTFADSVAYAWLQENAYKYGFILRYPEGKEYLTGYSAESWHYRYVGLDAAEYIYKNSITFDEYYAYFVE